MNYFDQGIIISIKNYGESSMIIKILSKEKGIIKAFKKFSKSKKQHSVLQVGNLVSFNFSSRLEENLGNFNHFDLIQSYALNIMFNKLKLDCTQSILSMLDELFLERDPSEFLFNKVNEFLSFLSSNQQSSNVIIAKYIKLELLILEILGYGIDFSSCVVTNSKVNLAYISPKSARAVSLEASKGYEHKLLKLPKFLIDANHNLNYDQFFDSSEEKNHPENLNDLMMIDDQEDLNLANDQQKNQNQSLLEALELSEYFFNKHLNLNHKNSHHFFRNNIKKHCLS